MIISAPGTSPISGTSNSALNVGNAALNMIRNPLVSGLTKDNAEYYNVGGGIIPAGQTRARALVSLKPQSEIDKIIAGKQTAAINKWISDEVSQGFKTTGTYSLERDEGGGVTTLLNIDPNTGDVSQSQRVYTPPQAPQANTREMQAYHSLTNLQRELEHNDRLTDVQREFIKGGIAELSHELTGAPVSYFLGTPATEETKLMDAYKSAVSQNTRDVILKRLQDITNSNTVFNPSAGGFQSMAPSLQTKNPANLIYDSSTSSWNSQKIQVPKPTNNVSNVINQNLPPINIGGIGMNYPTNMTGINLGNMSSLNLGGNISVANLGGFSSMLNSNSSKKKGASTSKFQDMLNANILGR